MSVTIISELGINHGGNLDTAKEMIKVSKECGADAVKFQKRTISKVYSPEELAKYREHPFGGEQTTRRQKEALEFNEEQYNEVDRYCKEIGIIWFASAWDVDSQKFLRKYDLPFNKVASAMLCHKELLHTIAEEKKYTFISTGMSNGDEIDRAVQIFNYHKCPMEIVHCNSQYPANDEKLNLNCIKTLKEIYPEINIGYSCHSTGIIPPVIAVALGATSIEKHLTLNRSSYGSDQSSSVEPQGFKRMCEYIRFTEKILGDGVKRVTEEEEIIKKKLRRIRDY